MNDDLSRRDWMKLAVAGPVTAIQEGQGYPNVTPLPAPPHVGPGEPALARRVTLEMSLKPFRVMEPDAIRAVCERLFRQWAPLLRRVDATAVMLWTADGSEILAWSGKMDDPIEWGRYIGVVNPPTLPPDKDPAELSIHERARLYTAEPANITYFGLRSIVRALKSVGRAMTGKPVTVGATFDPGPEFARSPFKYEKHSEIFEGQWLDCGALLHADPDAYAGFPRGIPQGTPIGTFLGRQAQRFLTGLEFDYIWFSNGFGFSATSYKVKGALFDGRTFDTAKAAAIREKILTFWKSFRAECPSFRVECRGSNLSTGADLSASATPLKDIYDGGFNIVAPPNSPWAAIDGDFGLELSGYLSHIAHLPPGDEFPFRFYTHDPWWLNSPWFDRYGREPHDIYLPLALARIDSEGRVTRPSSIEFLTADNSYGEMPDQCPNEVTPHVLSALDHYSDEPGLMTWIYPFREHHAMVFGPSPRADAVFFSDWFLRDAINAGLPLNTVVSSDNFLSSLKRKPGLYRDTVLLAPVPEAGSAVEAALLDSLPSGQRVFLFGPASHASKRVLELLGVKLAAPLSGELELRSTLEGDTIRRGALASKLLHSEITSAGGIDTVSSGAPAPGCEVCATASGGASERVYAVSRTAGAGRLVWVRGSFCSAVTESALPRPFDARKHFPAQLLMRHMLSRFGIGVHVEKPVVETRNPLLVAARSNNGFYMSGYSPSTAANLRLRFPHGAPLLIGYETSIENGHATYHLPRAWHRECRCFVEQNEAAEIGCTEAVSEEPGIRRRLLIRGLGGGTVHFFPELQPSGPPVRMENRGQRIPYETQDGGRRLVVRNVSGELRVSW